MVRHKKEVVEQCTRSSQGSLYTITRCMRSLHGRQLHALACTFSCTYSAAIDWLFARCSVALCLSFPFLGYDNTFAFTGIIADKVFGYRGAVGREADPALQAVNATALGNSLLAVLGVPWLLCFIAYFRAQPPPDPASLTAVSHKRTPIRAAPAPTKQ